MRFTARQIIGHWLKTGVNLTGIERALELPFGSLKPLHDNEGPAPGDVEVLLNMINRFPWLINVADKDFSLKKIVTELFDEWKEGVNNG